MLPDEDGLFVRLGLGDRARRSSSRRFAVIKTRVSWRVQLPLRYSRGRREVEEEVGGGSRW